MRSLPLRALLLVSTLGGAALTACYMGTPDDDASTAVAQAPTEPEEGPGEGPSEGGVTVRRWTSRDLSRALM